MSETRPATMHEARTEIKQLEKRLLFLKRLQPCNWKRIPWEYGKLYRCTRCKCETANLPLYKDSSCGVNQPVSKKNDS